MKPPQPPAVLPRGFRFAATACGLKKTGALDLGLLVSDQPASAAALFTSNLVKAAPVLLCREHLRASKGRMRAAIVNSGNANCSVGPSAAAASQATAVRAAAELRCAPEQVFVCSTGVIGVALSVGKILAAMPRVTRAGRDSTRSFTEFAHAILTTDTRPKWAAASCRIGGKTVRFAGCAKGAGMIHPRLATMLAFIVTDAAIAPGLLQRTLVVANAQTFNSITVDGDSSTNDTVLVLANGGSGAKRITAGTSGHTAFRNALEKLCKSLALQIVADGEGAQRIIEIEVRGARTEAAARRVAETIATSPLVKTAFAGGDPNWGRILAAAGRSGVKFDPDEASIAMAGIPVYRRGRALPFNEAAAHRRLLAEKVPIRVDLRAGRSTARVWTCDFTAEYVRINASYRT
jgi:glutamate N-acetyltransferase / amino-acid N-acetyltransferase